MTPETIELAINSTAAQAVHAMRSRCYNDTPIVDALTGPQAQVCHQLIAGAIRAHLESVLKPEKSAHPWGGRDTKGPRKKVVRREKAAV